jgi:putative endonuclease
VGGTPHEPQFRRYPLWKRWFGQRSERVAAKFLRQRGFHILARNWSDTLGELDLIAVDRRTRTLIIVEVRSTASADSLRAELSVDLAKQRRVIAAALRYLQRHRLKGINVRMDVVIISWPDTAARPTIHHYPGAFESLDRWQLWS